jgi:tetratricopeptide (TPR) repeat protein
MKKVLTALIILASFNISFAQNKNIVSCYNHLKYREYDKAKAAIDKAVEHPKTMSNPKAWWYRGNTYQILGALCQSGKAEYCTMAPNAADVAKESYGKALALNMKDPKWHELDIYKNKADLDLIMKLSQQTKNVVNIELFREVVFEKFARMANLFVQKAVAEYESEDQTENAKAAESFKISLTYSGVMGTIDTAVIYWVARSADKVDDFETAKEYYRKSISLDYGENDKAKAWTYKYMASIHLREGDTTQYLQTLKDGIDKYPEGSTVIMPDLINHYLVTEQTQEALAYLKLAIEANPDNSTYYFAEGTLYDKAEDFDNAILSYQKSLEIDPEFFDANYNLGAVHYNVAAQYIKDAIDLPLDKQKQYDALIEKANAKFKVAQPYLEKAHELTPDDLSAMMSLKEIYFRLKMYDQSNEMKAKIEAADKK